MVFGDAAAYAHEPDMATTDVRRVVARAVASLVVDPDLVSFGDRRGRFVNALDAVEEVLSTEHRAFLQGPDLKHAQVRDEVRRLEGRAQGGVVAGARVRGWGEGGGAEDERSEQDEARCVNEDSESRLRHDLASFSTKDELIAERAAEEVHGSDGDQLPTFRVHRFRFLKSSAQLKPGANAREFHSSG